MKIFNFVISILYDVLNFKETKYKSDAINAITAKDLDKFIISVKYHLIIKFISRLVNHCESKFFNYFWVDNHTQNIMLEKILLKKDMVFFDLFKTGELNNKVQFNKDFPNFNIIETCTKIGEYIFKIFYFGYYLYKDFFEMSAIYMTIVMIQMIVEPFLFNDIQSDDMIEKLELRDNYINDILSNIRLVKSFATEKKELKRLVNIIGKIREQGFWKKFFQDTYNQLYSINDLLIFYECGKKTILGKMNYGELLIFERYSTDFKAAFMSLKEIFQAIKEGINSWIKFLEIYDIEQKIVSRKNIIPINEKNSDDKEIKGLSIDFKNVSFLIQLKKIQVSLMI